MTIPKLPKNPAARLRIGLVSLLVASLAQWLLHPTDAWQGPFDLGIGLFYGVAFALMLLSLRSLRGGETA
jgi:hypothetical protein